MQARFALFAFDRFYPAGGFNDFVGAYSSYIEAARVGAELGRDAFQIVDMSTMTLATSQTKARACAYECIAAISEGWGDAEDRKAAEQIVGIIAKYLEA